MSKGSPENQAASKVSEITEPSEVKQAPAAFKNTVHVAMSKDGGSGKSTLSRIFCEWYNTMKREVIIIDADENTPNVARVYDKDNFAKWGKKVKKQFGIRSSELSDEKLLKSRFEASILTASEEKQKNEDLFDEQIIFDDSPNHLYLGDRFLEIIETYSDRDIIVSLPGGNKFDFWLDTNEIDKSISKNDLPFKIVIWWCSFGSTNSQKTFVEFANKYPHIDTVLVLNKGIRSVVPNWDRFKFDPVLKDLKSKKARSAEIEQWLSNPDILEEVDRSTPFHEILENGLHGKPFSSLIRNKIQGWFEVNWDSLMATGHLG